MLETFKVLIVDLFFILILSLFTEIILDKKNWSGKKRTFVYSFTYSIALLFNMIFHVSINQEFQMDLRHTVFVIAGLYGGLRCLPPLLLLVSMYIVLMYPHEAYANTLTLLVEVVAISLLSKYYHNWRLRQKLAFLGFATFANGFLVMKTVQYFFGFTTGYDFWIITFYAFSIMILVLVLEWVRNSIAINQRIQRAEKLELVSHLAASISHEVRNPLTVTRGFLQILESDEFSPEKKKEYFALAKSELDRAELIIRDYLTFAKPYPNKTEQLILKDEINHVLEIMGPLANMNSVSIQTDLGDEVIVGEMQLFHQSLINILKNGIEAMEENGGVLKISTLSKGSLVEINISDTGVGMNEEQIKRLGEPYFSTRGKSGTGLGMMVVYSIIHTMKGKITVKSQIGHGTTFVITFPKSTIRSVKTSE